jgi:predicted nucleotidyltransferase component of viral defense system
MLQTQTVDKATLALLNHLMQLPIFSEFRLVGGTALALQYGHRKSIDLDLFGPTDFREIDFNKTLAPLGEVKINLNTTYIKTFLINQIKVDFVSYSYPWIDDCLIFDGIRLATDREIAGMKLNAITNRGTKKDFFDLFFLLKHFSLKEMITLFEQKYHDATPILALRSLCYFEDAENNPDPEMLENVSWEQVKTTIKKLHLEYMNGL